MASDTDVTSGGLLPAFHTDRQTTACKTIYLPNKTLPAAPAAHMPKNVWPETKLLNSVQA